MTVLLSPPLENAEIDCVEVLIDADTLLYRVGFLWFPSQEEYEKACVDSFRKTILKCESMAKKFYPHIDAIRVRLFFTRKGPKYRSLFDKECKYKEHRKKAAKPRFVEEMMRAISLHLPYERISLDSTEGEADDCLSIAANYLRSIYVPYLIAGCDKDLRQIPGNHYNYLTDSHMHITHEMAYRFFFTQLLMGDVADNVPGIKGVGIKRAGYILHGAISAEDMWDYTVSAYMTAYDKTMSEEEISELLYERANKLYLLKYRGDQWYPPIPEFDPKMYHGY